MAKIGTFVRKRTTFFRPAREHIFSWKYLPLTFPTKFNHPGPEKNLYVERNYLRVTKSWSFGYWNLNISRDSPYWTGRTEHINRKKFTLPNIALNNASNILLFFNPDVYEWHNYLLNFWQKVHIFSNNWFRIDIMIRMARKDLLIAHFGIARSRVTNKKLTH